MRAWPPQRWGPTRDRWPTRGPEPRANTRGPGPTFCETCLQSHWDRAKRGRVLGHPALHGLGRDTGRTPAPPLLAPHSALSRETLPSPPLPGLAQTQPMTWAPRLIQGDQCRLLPHKGPPHCCWLSWQRDWAREQPRPPPASPLPSGASFTMNPHGALRYCVLVGGRQPCCIAGALDAMRNFHAGTPSLEPLLPGGATGRLCRELGGRLPQSSALKNFGLRSSGIWIC